MSAEDVFPRAMDLLLAGEPAAAEALLAPLAARNGDDVQVHYFHAAALLGIGEEARARQAFETAWMNHAFTVMGENEIALDRVARDAAYALEVGRLFYGEDYVGVAAAACGCALNDATVAANEGLFVYGQSLHHAGRIEAALGAFDKALALTGASYLSGFVLYSLMFAKDGLNRQAETARRWGEVMRKVAPAAPTFPPAWDGQRKLRVGYVAPSFANQLRHFTGPLFDNHDADRFEVFAYVDHAEAEALPAQVTVRSCKALTYDAHADLIRADAIDVLVDVWGHASGNRLAVFARQPAPVQVAWLNWIQTTGLETMDYSMLGSQMLTADAPPLFVETLYDIGPILAPFRPTPTAKTSPSPAIANGFLTFGSFNHPAKLSDETIAGWARLLHASPTAKLLCKYGYFVDPVLQTTTQCRFLAYGIAPQRILFEGKTTGEEYEQAFAEIDFALDPTPVGGGTTTMEAVSRGVPVLAIRGRDYYSRVAVEALGAMGLDDLLFDDWSAMAEFVARLDQDHDALAVLRARVRPAYDASAYRDEAGFTRRMEAAFAEMAAKTA
ncbi:O-linked N-acetylglucosamine transferase family protein [Caulobacter hibisci]|uniref:O-GlcNAc transferase C-terminal domain-containing protein n=1 Tax=Caulobacter hibisci TaxID=2035993 RepID=A0ABS0T0B1_9CAUL|nr:hypothetical protein [Caulobacter hibisci]MBI1684961.1 hypothetical protein [Caulobacter hibisci]